jgi:hypothetical protein
MGNVAKGLTLSKEIPQFKAAGWLFNRFLTRELFFHGHFIENGTHGSKHKRAQHKIASMC